MSMNGAYFNDLDGAGQQSALANIPGSATTDYILFSLNVANHTSADISYGWAPDLVVAHNAHPMKEATILTDLVVDGVTKGNCKRVWLTIGAPYDPNWPSRMPTTFTNIQKIFDTGGTLKSTLLANFRALFQAVIYAGNFKVEVGFDMNYQERLFPGPLALYVANLTSALYQHLSCPVTFRPYQRLVSENSPWIAALAQVYANLGMKAQPVIGFNLQTYAGGNGNVPAQWVDAIKNSRYRTGVPDPAGFVWPVVSCDDTAQPITPADKLAQTLKDWKSKGASFWAMQPLGQPPADLKAYSAAIAQGIA